MERQGMISTNPLVRGSRNTVRKQGARISRTYCSLDWLVDPFCTNCIFLLLALTLMLTPAMAQVQSAEVLSMQQEVEYVRTIDGDTIVVIYDGTESKFSLLAVNAPELEDGTSEAFSAAQYLAEILENAGTVYIEHGESSITDEAGNQLCWLWFRPVGDSDAVRILVQQRILSAGYADYVESNNYKYPELASSVREDPEQIKIPQISMRAAGEGESASGEVRITDKGLRWLSSSYGYAEYSRRIELSNRTGERVIGNIKIDLLDIDGFTVDSDYMFNQIVEVGTQDFSTTSMIADDLAAKVRSFRITFESN